MDAGGERAVRRLAQLRCVPGHSSITPAGPTVDSSVRQPLVHGFQPRASLVHEVNSHVSWSASVYRAFRAPTLNELYRSFRQANNLTVANANLTAERLTGGEAGIAAQEFNGRLQFRGSFFFNEIINPISSVSCQVTPRPGHLPGAYRQYFHVRAREFRPHDRTRVRTGLARANHRSPAVIWRIPVRRCNRDQRSRTTVAREPMGSPGPAQ